MGKKKGSSSSHGGTSGMSAADLAAARAEADNVTIKALDEYIIEHEIDEEEADRMRAANTEVQQIIMQEYLRDLPERCGFDMKKFLRDKGSPLDALLESIHAQSQSVEAPTGPSVQSLTAQSQPVQYQFLQSHRSLQYQAVLQTAYGMFQSASQPMTQPVEEQEERKPEVIETFDKNELAKRTAAAAAGQPDTKQSFADPYGGTEECGSSTQKEMPVLEQRIDKMDGQPYTKQSFIRLYGGTKEWEESIEYLPSKASGSSGGSDYDSDSPAARLLAKCRSVLDADRNESLPDARTPSQGPLTGPARNDFSTGFGRRYIQDKVDNATRKKFMPDKIETLQAASKQQDHVRDRSRSRNKASSASIVKPKKSMTLPFKSNQTQEIVVDSEGYVIDKDELVNQVKEWRKNTGQGKRQWSEWVDKKGTDGKKDPAFYDATFLNDFLNSARAMPRVASAKEETEELAIHTVYGERGKIVGPGMWMDPMKESLVGQVKYLNKDQTIKDRWEIHCDKYPTSLKYARGALDPWHHEVFSLQAFLESLPLELQKEAVTRITLNSPRS